MDVRENPTGIPSRGRFNYPECYKKYGRIYYGANYCAQNPGIPARPLPLVIYLINVIASLATLTGTQFNSRGALCNAKKIVEEGLSDGKGTDTYAEVVI